MLTSTRVNHILSAMRFDVARLKLRTALTRQSIDNKEYNQNQPRQPAGQPDGGQWVDLGGESVMPGDRPRSTRRTHLVENSQEFCDEQYKRDVFHCKMVGLRSCYSQAMVRLVACERGHPIPPLSY